MSERERWIIYPLLFFALGAAVRDKILHRIDAKEIYCESLKIVDRQDPTGLAYAELSIKRAKPNDPNQLADRRGSLRLVDSEGHEICHLDSNSLRIIDQQGSKVPAFAELSIKQAKPHDPTQLADRVGLLRLVDSEGHVVCRLDHNAFLPRLISKRLDIVDAIGQQRAVATTEPGERILLPNGEETATSQGVIYLNNQKLGIRLAPPANRQPAPKLPPDSTL